MSGSLAVSDLVVAIGLALVLEGIFYGGFPAAAKRMAAQVADIPEPVLRTVGLAAAAAGLVVVWMIRG